MHFAYSGTFLNSGEVKTQDDSGSFSIQFSSYLSKLSLGKKAVFVISCYGILGRDRTLPPNFVEIFLFQKMNGSKSSSQPGQEEDDVSSHDVRASDESSDHDVLMDDEDNPEENSEDGVESEKESPSVFSTNFTRGAVMEKCSERISNADSETDEKDTTLEDDDGMVH